MCGIFGEFYFQGDININNSLERLNLMNHRGPDGYGFEYGNFNTKANLIYHNVSNEKLVQLDSGKSNYFLGHRRLSIIDLNDNAFQPMESIDGNYSIIFNGEIYNYIELKEELERSGCSFKTDHSDTEVLLNAYIYWDVKCMEKIRGMFAFAIYDRNRQILFIARDRIGKKPLYYEFSNTRFAFSSELKPLLLYEKREVNEEALCFYMQYGYILHPLSFFKGINKLPPATYLLADLKNKSIKLETYWDLDLNKVDQKPADEFLEDIEKSLEEAVSLRLRSDVPVGAFISGGIDSTLVVRKMKEVGQKSFDIFGADFPQPEKSEKEYIQKVASRYSQKLNLMNIGMSHVDDIEDIIAVFDEPFDGGSSVAVFDLFRKAKENYKVILTGDGGDEMFAGYERYSEFPRRYSLFRLLSYLYFPGKILKLLSYIWKKNIKLNKLKNIVTKDFLTNYISGDEFGLKQLVKKDFRTANQDLTIFKDILLKIKNERPSYVKALQYFELKTILPGRMLYKIDRFSMYYGIEARSPFLDHKLAEMAFTIPDGYNVNNGKTKLMLKKILEKDFDKEFIYRKKMGFGNPFSYWFENIDFNKVFRVLIDEKSEIFRYLDYDRLHLYFPGIKNGYKRENEKELWRMLVLGHYFESVKDILVH